MKKLLLLAMLAATIQFVNAQDFTKVKTAYLINKFEEAKNEIDKVTADPKSLGKAETWYWKSMVYAGLSKDAAMRTKYPNLLKDADDAFKKYIELDPGFAQVKDKGAQGFFDIYATSYNGGIKVFNEKKWDEAGKLFESAIYYIDMILKNKWTSASIAFDTSTVLYAAYSFQNAANDSKLDEAAKAAKLDQAAKYYRVLADNKVAGKDYVDVYKFLMSHYTATKNNELFKKYVAIKLLLLQ